MLATNPVTANLIKARELISDEKNWGQRALRWEDRLCALGAVFTANGTIDNDRRETTWEVEFLAKAALEISTGDVRVVIDAYRSCLGRVFELNDRTDHPTVMRMFDRAIELSLQP